MSMTFDEISHQAMLLPAESRADLAEQLVESLANPDAEKFRRVWASEALRRRDELRSGKVKPIPGDQVLSEVRRKVGR